MPLNYLPVTFVKRKHDEVVKRGGAKTVAPNFKRQPRRATPNTPASARITGSNSSMKIDYGAFLSVGILFAVFRDPSSPKAGVFTGGYLSDIEANTDNMAEKTNTTRGFYAADETNPTHYKQVLTKNGSRYVQKGILIHVCPDQKSVTNPEKRRIFASNHSKVLNAYSKSTFKYPMTYESGDDLTATCLSNGSVVADYLTWDDTMDLLKENIFVDQTVETLAASDIIMRDYFGRHWEKARKYFLEAEHPATNDIKLESFD